MGGRPSPRGVHLWANVISIQGRPEMSSAQPCTLNSIKACSIHAKSFQENLIMIHIQMT